MLLTFVGSLRNEPVILPPRLAEGAGVQVCLKDLRQGHDWTLFIREARMAFEPTSEHGAWL